MYHSRGVSNVNVRRRIRQIVVLVFTIIIGVLISQGSQAQSQIRSYKERGVAKPHNNRVKMHALRFSHRECQLLAQKRNFVPKTSVFASNAKPKRKSMAEIDIPQAVKPVAVRPGQAGE